MRRAWRQVVNPQICLILMKFANWTLKLQVLKVSFRYIELQLLISVCGGGGHDYLGRCIYLVNIWYKEYISIAFLVWSKCEAENVECCRGWCSHLIQWLSQRVPQNWFHFVHTTNHQAISLACYSSVLAYLCMSFILVAAGTACFTTQSGQV